MGLPLLIKALILGIVEGLTEFLPISSTGHLILAGALLHFNDEIGTLFEVVIQAGAMLAIIWEYRARFARVTVGLFSDAEIRRFVLNLGLAFLPAAVLGLFLSKFIKRLLFKPLPVALAFIVGALVILWIERKPRVARVETVEQITPLDAFKVGLAQALALVPGTSRSGATIMGGMLFGLSRRAATEFSFFLAVPTLLAASGYDLLKHRHLLSADQIGLFAVGLCSAFASAFLCVRWLLRFISQHDFRGFAWYRIAFGVLVLVTGYMGWVDWSQG
ncbi:MAG: undecaprenyl-diphosphate phosphatase [Polyangiaceae bacterium]